MYIFLYYTHNIYIYLKNMSAVIIFDHPFEAQHESGQKGYCWISLNFHRSMALEAPWILCLAFAMLAHNFPRSTTAWEPWWPTSRRCQEPLQRRNSWIPSWLLSAPCRPFSSVWIPTRHAHQPWHRWATLALVSPDWPPCSPSVQRPGSQPPMPQPTASRRRLVLPRRLVARMDCCSWTCWQAPCFPFSAECEGTGKPLLKHWQVPRTCPLHGKWLSKDWQVQRTFPLPLVPFGGQQRVLSSRLIPSLSSLILLLLENICSATTSCWCCCSLVWT